MSDQKISHNRRHNGSPSWLVMEAEVGNLVRLHHKHKEEFMRREGVKLTLLPFYIKAIIQALKSFPQMNGSLSPDGGLTVKQEIHLRLSTESAGELATAVIEHADRISLAGIAHLLDGLRNRENGCDSPESGSREGTFSVKSLPGAGTLLSTPELHDCQAAGISFESIVQKPVFMNDSLMKGYFVNMCLSYDKRILNEAACVKFLQSVKKHLGEYSLEELIYS